MVDFPDIVDQPIAQDMHDRVATLLDAALEDELDEDVRRAILSGAICAIAEQFWRDKPARMGAAEAITCWGYAGGAYIVQIAAREAGHEAGTA